MLFGREAECAAVDALLTGARVGNAGALSFVGDPGLGKSALLAYALSRADGFRVLTTTGVESESSLAFGGLLDLLRPVLDRLAKIPWPQQRAIAGALALGPPTPADRFSVGAATLSLLATAAEAEPLLLVVDDAQWVDAPTLDAVLFAVRRLRREVIATLLAVRTGTDTGPDTAGLTTLTLHGLPEAAGLALLAARANRSMDVEVARALVSATGGNPLALLETAQALSDAQLAGAEPLPDPIPAAGAERAFSHRLARLREPTRRALTLAAAAGSEPRAVVEAAAARLGVDIAVLDATEAGDLVAMSGDRFDFRHPLIRSAVYHSASGAERRAVHRALATVIDGRAAGQRRSTHLAASATGPDESVAAELAAAAGEAESRGGYVAAATTYERSATLTPEPATATGRRLAAAAAAQLGGRYAYALGLLDAALSTADDPLTRGRIQRARGGIIMMTAAPMAAHRLFVDEADRVCVHDPDLAAAMLVDAALAAFQAGAISTAVDVSARAEQLAVTESTRQAAALVACDSLVLAGRPQRARRIVEDLRHARPDFTSASTFLAMHPYTQMCLWLEEYDLAASLAETVISAARQQSLLSPLPYLLAVRSELQFRLGNWLAARADAQEAIELARLSGQEAGITLGLVCLARVDAGQGRFEDASATVIEATALADRLGIHSIHVYAGSVLGLLELGRGDAAAAVRYLQQTTQRLKPTGMNHPCVVQWAPDLIEAYLWTRQRTEATAQLRILKHQAEVTDCSWARATAARCTGMLAESEDFDAAFRDALAEHEATPTPFESARTRLRYGERLRRVGRIAAARSELHAAQVIFERLGALPWATKCRDELRATGERVQQAEPHAAGHTLTAQELKIALTVAQGATNRETAAALFLSPKTVEFHLGNVYRKLSLRSRTELARWAARADTSVA